LVLDLRLAESQSTRYGGTRWKIAYGSYEGKQSFAVNELQRVLQGYLPYVIETRPAAQIDSNEANTADTVLVGTASDNHLIAELEAKGLIQHPDKPRSYTIGCLAEIARQVELALQGRLGAPRTPNRRVARRRLMMHGRQIARGPISRA
jgi:hypothetical protein